MSESNIYKQACKKWFLSLRNEGEVCIKRLGTSRTEDSVGKLVIIVSNMARQHWEIDRINTETVYFILVIMRIAVAITLC